MTRAYVGGVPKKPRLEFAVKISGCHGWELQRCPFYIQNVEEHSPFGTSCRVISGGGAMPTIMLLYTSASHARAWAPAMKSRQM